MKEGQRKIEELEDAVLRKVYRRAVEFVKEYCLNRYALRGGLLESLVGPMDAVLSEAIGPRPPGEHHGYLDPFTPLAHASEDFILLMDCYCSDADQLTRALERMRYFASPPRNENYSGRLDHSPTRRNDESPGWGHWFLQNPEDKPVGVRYLEQVTGRRYY